jgi:hypothetical protein
MLDDALLPTAVVEIENVVLLEPAGTVTFADTVATDLLLDVSVTTAPPLGADPLKVTVPCEDVPPITVTGLSETPETVTEAPSTVRVA